MVKALIVILLLLNFFCALASQSQCSKSSVSIENDDWCRCQLDQRAGLLCTLQSGRKVIYYSASPSPVVKGAIVSGAVHDVPILCNKLTSHCQVIMRDRNGQAFYMQVEPNTNYYLIEYMSKQGGIGYWLYRSYIKKLCPVRP